MVEWGDLLRVVARKRNKHIPKLGCNLTALILSCRDGFAFYGLKFFDPENSRRAKKLFRFTIDVSDIIPVTLGEVRSWSTPY